MTAKPATQIRALRGKVRLSRSLRRQHQRKGGCAAMLLAAGQSAIQSERTSGGNSSGGLGADLLEGWRLRHRVVCPLHRIGESQMRDPFLHLDPRKMRLGCCFERSGRTLDEIRTSEGPQSGRPSAGQFGRPRRDGGASGRRTPAVLRWVKGVRWRGSSPGSRGRDPERPDEGAGPGTRAGRFRGWRLRRPVVGPSECVVALESGLKPAQSDQRPTLEPSCQPIATNWVGEQGGLIPIRGESSMGVCSQRRSERRLSEGLEPYPRVGTF